MIVIIMEGFEAMSIITCIAAFILMLWSGKSMKVKGGYIETMCNIEFQRGRIKWQYPSIDLQDGNGAASVVYYIYENEIKSILLRNLTQPRNPFLENRVLSCGRISR